MKFLESIKANGMRKMIWGLIALISLEIVCIAAKYDGTIFRDCFIAIVGFVMGANYGEHKEKSKAARVAPAVTRQAAP